MSDVHLQRRPDAISPEADRNGPADGDGAYKHGLDASDALRAHHYGLLAVLLAGAPSSETLDLLAGISGDSSPLGRAHDALAQAARSADAVRVEREYFKLFIGVGRGELVPYGSYYLTGFLQEKPLARLRQDLAELGIERSPDVRELEDHVAVLCETMVGLIDGRFGTPADADIAFFGRHLAPFAGRFFADLEAADAASFYKHVGAVGRALMDIETEALARAA